MKPAAFAYAKARSLDHAIALMGDGGDGARLLAGGQSLMATLNMRLSHPSLLVDINGLGLNAVSVDKGSVSIGALTRHAAAERSSDIARHVPLIARALPHIAHPAIRNRGTIGGSVAFADPAAELPACLVALDGEAEITGPGGQRTVAADAFFTGLYETALGPQDLLTAIRVPAATADTRTGFAEFARRLGDYALVGLAASGQAKSGRLGSVRLAYFGIAQTPVRARGAEEALAAGDLDGAVAALGTDLDPEGDIHADAAVKRHLAGVLLRRVAGQLAEARS